MNDIICPRCFEKSTKKEFAWGCTNSDCSREMIPTTVKDTIAKPKCTDCGNVMDARFCPHCGFHISNSSSIAPGLPISVIGSQGSGKSNYLAVLINEIRHNVGKVYDCSLYPVGGDDTMVEYQNQYYKPLYEEGVCIESTDQDSVRPLVYSLVFNEEKKDATTVTFYDACGANFRSERVMKDYNRSIYNSKGILFLVDPTQLPGVREQYLAQGKPVLDDDFSDLLSRTIQLIRKGEHKRDLNKKIEIPIAVCISKFDLLKPFLDNSSYLKYPSRHLQEDAFDIIDFRTTSHEIEALVDTLSGTDLINQVRSQFKHCGFFAFSALGTQPTEDNEIPHISPHRVSDPFLWLLAQNRVIRTTRKTITK